MANIFELSRQEVLKIVRREAMTVHLGPAQLPVTESKAEEHVFFVLLWQRLTISFAYLCGKKYFLKQCMCSL